MVKVKENDLYFPVKLIKNPNKTNREYSRIVEGTVDKKKMHLNYCSPIYELIPNEDIFPNIKETFNDNGISFESNFQNYNNVRFYGTYNITDPEFKYTMKDTGDIIFPKADIQHSYNGKTKYRIYFGYFRLICSNGLVVPVEEMKKYNLEIIGRHTSQILQSFSQFDLMLKDFVENKDQVQLAITGKYEDLSGHWVKNPADRLKEVLEHSNISIVDNKSRDTIGQILSSIQVESNNTDLGYNGKVNDWLIYNGVNQYIYDEEVYKKKAPEAKVKKDQAVLQYLLHTA